MSTPPIAIHQPIVPIHNPQSIAAPFSPKNLNTQPNASHLVQPLPTQATNFSQFNKISDSEQTFNVNYTINSGENLAKCFESSLLISKTDTIGTNDKVFYEENYSENIQLEENSHLQQQTKHQRSRFSSTISNNDPHSNSIESQEDNIDPVDVVPINFNSYYTNFTQVPSSFNYELPAPPEIPLDKINSSSLNFSTQPALSNTNLAENQNLSDLDNIGTSIKSTDNMSNNSLNKNKGGLFSSLKNRIGKIIPNNNSMILPDDTNPSVKK